MNTPQDPNTETVKIKYNKYSFWTVIKIVMAFMVITWLGNTFSYITVAMNHVFSKLIGLAVDAADFCAGCLQSIAG